MKSSAHDRPGTQTQLSRRAALAFALTNAGGEGRPLGVAVSGGSDSMALLMLAAEHASSAGYSGIVAATVDHGLRPEAAEEARQVHRACAALSIEHDILTWQPDVARAVGQERARLARHALLAQWARRRGAAHLALGHTRDDRLETFLMRARQGSGWYGLAGPMPMAPSPAWPEGKGVAIIRPLLPFSREELRDDLRTRGHGWIEDPSNANARFERVRIRRMIAAMTPAHRNKAIAIMDRLAVLRTAVQEQAHGLLAHLQDTEAGERAIALSRRDHVGAEAWRRFVEAMVMAAGGAATPPRTDSLTRLLARIAANDQALARGVTLAGAKIRVRKGALLAFRQAPPRQGETAREPAAWSRAERLLAPAGADLLSI